MIYITQGHNEGIGIEVFLKSFLCLGSKRQEKMVFIGSREALEKTLRTLKIPFNIKEEKLEVGDAALKVILTSSGEYSETLDSLIHAISVYKKGDIILTLPSSKDQFCHEGKSYRGHTEFLKHYLGEEPGMCFLGPQCNFLLLTDHIELEAVYPEIQKMNLTSFITNVIKSLPKNRRIDEVLMAGINPHFGEGGNISKQDEILKNLDSNFLNSYNVKFFSGDTMVFEKPTLNKLFIFPSHDQGLGVFKTKFGLTGINYTANMKIVRASVDHGTAFNLYGKNTADYQGMSYLLDEVQNWQ